MPQPAPTLRLVGRSALPRAMATWHLSLPMPELLVIAALGGVLALA